MKTSATQFERVVTHFRVPGREMLFDQPECCPSYGGLSFDGLAIDENDGVHLIVRTTSARAYLGPDLPVVARRAHILAVALVDAGSIDTERAGSVIAWLGECWTAAANEIAQAAGLAAGDVDMPTPVGDVVPTIAGMEYLPAEIDELTRDQLSREYAAGLYRDGGREGLAGDGKCAAETNEAGMG